MFRKIKKATIIFMCLLAMMGFTRTEAKASGMLSSVDWSDKGAANVSDYLNIRSGPSADSDVVAVLLPGRVVTITGSDGDWSKVSSAGYAGYVMTKYLATGDSARKLCLSKAGARGSVTASALVIREKPSTDSAKLISISQGSILTLTAKEDGWYKASCLGVSGYVMGKYVEEKGPRGAISPEAFAELQGDTSASTASTKSTKSTEKKTTKKKSSSDTSKSNGYVIKCSDEELDMLAAIVACEAGGESDQGKLAVAAVVVNRVQSKRYPSSVEKVIKQKSQFSPVASGSFARRLKKGASKSCYTAAKRALSGEDPTSGALHFHAGHSKKGIQIDNQYFY